MADPVLHERAAATYLAVSPHTLRDWRSKRCQCGPRYVKLGPGKNSRVAYRQSDLDAWIAARVKVPA